MTEILRFDERMNLHGRRNVRQPYSFERGYAERGQPLVFYPERLVLENSQHQVCVDFNNWINDSEAPPINFTPNLPLPFPWKAVQVQEKLEAPETVHTMNNIICGMPLLPLPIYTPTAYLMLNGVRAGSALHKDLFAQPVIDSFDVMLAYFGASHILVLSADPYTVSVLGNTLNNYKRSEEQLLREFSTGLTSDERIMGYAEELRKRFNEAGLEAIEQARDGEEALFEFAKYLASFQQRFLALLEHRIYTLIDPALTQPPRTFYNHGALPLANPEQPHYALAVELQTREVCQSQFAFLRLKALQKEMPFLLPASCTFSMEQVECGLSLHLLRLLLLVMHFKKTDFVVGE